MFVMICEIVKAKVFRYQMLQSNPNILGGQDERNGSSSMKGQQNMFAPRKGLAGVVGKSWLVFPQSLCFG